MSDSLKQCLSYLALALVGGICVLSFAPFEWYFLTFVCLSVLVYAWQGATARTAFMYGLSFGFGLYVFGVSWVYNSLAVYGGMPLWMGSIAVVGFSLLIALFMAFAGLALAVLTKPNTGFRLFCAAPCFVVFEWGKSWVLTGFPWLDIGYSQTPSLLFELAPIGGLYLISFAVIAICSSLVYLLVNSILPPSPLASTAAESATKPSNLRAVSPLLIVSTFVVALSYFGESRSWGEDAGPSVRVGIVQPNTPIEKKWGLAYRDKVIAGLVERNNDLVENQALDLIVWPETALPVLLSQTDAAFWDAVRPANTALLSGLVERRYNEDGTISDYNAAVLHCGDHTQVYRKRHLVPFGEYLPLRFLFQWVLDYLQLPMSDFSSWQAQQSLSCGERLKLGLSICYEDAFSGEHREYAQGATLLVNISEDAWFGDSFAPHQRLQMAQMRAKELALPLVRSANTGPSVLIDHRGNVLKISEQFVPASLVGSVQPRTGETWFRHFGEWVVYLSLLMLALAGVLSRRRF